MANARRFEIAVLRPLQIALTISVVILGLGGMWWWLLGGVIGILYLGVIGAKLHPLQSATDLSRGPLEGPAAQVEAMSLPPGVVKLLVGHACTSVGMLLGIAAGLVVWAVLGWRWYVTLPIALFTMIFTGALLKVAFKTIEYDENSMS